MKLGYRECKTCKAKVSRRILENNYCICPECGQYMRYHARKRIMSLADEGSYKEWKNKEYISNPLNDMTYKESFEKSKIKHNLNDAIVCGEIKINGEKVLIGVMDTRFMMASMGYIVGTCITVLFEVATKRKLPVLLFCCSAGARMQEGMISLMQMEKTSAAVKRHSEAGLLYISILTNPTMGGVTASFAMQADIILAEKEARIGFAGPRVIEQNTGQKLPPGFQTAEFQREHGFIDAVVDREDQGRLLSFFLKIHKKNKRKLKRVKKIEETHSDCYKKAVNKTPWEKVMTARLRERPTSMEYIERLFPDFFELSGDRVLEDDHAVVAGLATFQECPVTVIGHQKGKDSLQEARFRNWGMPLPSGYRKALRLAKQAEKFHRPVIFFVDTIGAACGKDAEEGGQGLAIANLLYEMSSLKTPILSIVIGEGGSGGALAFAVANEVWMLENSVYSILTPEGYASILWKDNSRAAEAAEKMGLTAEELYKQEIVEKIIAEDEPVTRENMQDICLVLEKNITNFLTTYLKKSGKSLVNERYKKFKKY